MEKDCRKELEGEDRVVRVLISYRYRGDRMERVITVDDERVYSDCQSIEARAKGGMNPLDRFEDWLNDAVSVEEVGETVMSREDVGDREMRLRCLEMIVRNGGWYDVEDLVGMAMILEHHVETGEKVVWERTGLPEESDDCGNGCDGGGNGREEGKKPRKGLLGKLFGFGRES